MMQFQVLQLLFLSAAVSASSQHVRYVKPDHPPSSCPGQPCLTLNRYISQAETYFTTGSTFLFLAGNHSVNSTLYLEDVSEILFKGCKNCSVTILLHEAVPVIQCENVYKITFEGIKFADFINAFTENLNILLTFYESKEVKLSNLTIEDYPATAVKINHSNVVILNSHFKNNRALQGGAIHVSDRSNITISKCLFRNNNVKSDNIDYYGYGGALFVAYGSNVTITDSIFERNTAGRGGALYVYRSSITIIRCLFQENAAVWGGALYAEPSNITIANCQFVGNTATLEDHSSGQGGALYVWYGNNVAIADSIFERNTAGEGGALHVYRSSITIFPDNTTGALYEKASNITIANCQFIGNNAVNGRGGALSVSSSNVIIMSCNGGATILHNNSALDVGGAIYSYTSTLTLTTRCLCLTSSCDNYEVDSKDMSKYFNDHLYQKTLGERMKYESGPSGTDFCITRNSGSAIIAFQSNLSFNGDVYIGMNSGETGGGIRASVSSSVSFTGTAVFEENHASEDGGAFWMQQSTISFDSTLLHNNTATGNGGAGFTTDSGSITIWNNITFSSNTATKGGALFFQNGATMKIKERATFYTAHNHANEYGGAIYHSDSILPAQCEFAMSDEESAAKLPLCFLQVKLEVYKRTPVYVINNTASRTGSFLYGGLLDKCKVYTNNWQPLVLLYPRLDIKRDDTISSQVYELCFCQTMHQYNCSTTKTITTHRGMRFTVSLLALAQGDTSSSATVRAKLSTSARLHPNQLLQDIPDKCTELSYNLYSANEMEQLILYPDGGPCSDIGKARATINVTFLPCPDAFTLSGDQCVCEERLQPYHVECNISEDSTFIERKAGSRVWMSAVYSNGTYQGLVLYPTCPMGYCRNNTVAVSLLNPDLQCDHNRSKVLCGACATKHSLMLGTSGCKVCSNAYLSLILSFAAAGIVLVVFLTLLRLTVATGMINSVILYANIVHANKDISLFSSSTNSVLTVFIAWINLDLGVQTCFYDGMDAYAQTWLQLAFPVYVWILISLIILISRYSITLTKLIGSNPIAVMATLLLMSYMKLLKIIIEVYSSVDLEYPGNKTVTVWLKDANEPYLQSRHLALTVVTTLLLVFLFLPYTLLLLLGYKLYSFTGRKHTRWLIKIKPLLDAYYAPYKMHTRYWTGFLLLVRCALYIVFSYNSLGEKKLSLLALNIVFTVITIWPWLTSKIYSKSLTNVIEAVVYLNLIALSAVALAKIDSPTLVVSLVGIVFVIMMGIIIYHFHIFYTSKSSLWLKLHAKMTALRAKPTEPTALRAESTEANLMLDPLADAALPEDVPAANARSPLREPTRSVVDICGLLQADNEQY